MSAPCTSAPLASAVFDERTSSRGRWPLLIAGAGLFVASRIVFYLVYAWSQNRGDVGGLAQAFCQWDCGWYLSIVDQGYDLAPHGHLKGDAANWAFFPLYPGLTALLSKLAVLSPVVAGELLSNVLLAATALVASATFEKRPRPYLIFCALVFLGPFSFYFSSVYTESLALLEGALCFYFLGRRRYVAAGLAGALFSATRIVGVFMSLAIAAAAWDEHRRNGGSLKTFIPFVLSRPDILLGGCLAPAGMVAYMAFLYVQTGDALAFSHIMRAWGREPHNPLSVLAHSLLAGDLPNVLHTDNSAVWASLWTVVALGLTGYLFWKRRLPEAIFSLFALVVPLSTGIASMPRYAISLYPLLVAAAELLDRGAFGRLVLLPLLIALNLALLYAWFHARAFLI